MTPSSPALTVRPSKDRGHAKHGWLDSRHAFSFGSYHDPDHMGFRTLRVINQDRVMPGAGFPPHPHRDMEIFSYVLEGSLKHEDSMGNQRVLVPGQIQLMSAGSGVTHSEFNPSATEPLHFLQIWIRPNVQGLTPGYTEWHPAASEAGNGDGDGSGRGTGKVLVISSDGREDSARIHQDAFVYRVRLDPREEASHNLEEGRGLWFQLIFGKARLNGVELEPGDGASSEEPGTFHVQAGDEAVEALWFDLG